MASVALPRSDVQRDPLGGKMDAAFVQGESSLPSSASRVSGTVSNTLFADGDWTTGYRAAQDCLATNILKNVPVGKVDTGLYQATGLGSAVYALFGPLWAMSGVDQISHAKEIGDREGVVDGRLNVALGSSFTLGGSAFGAFRALSIADIFVKNPTAAMAGATTATFIGGLAAYGVAFVAFAGLFGKNSCSGIQFENEFNKAEDKIAFLKEKINGTGDEFFCTEDELKELGMNLSKAIFSHRMKELGIDAVSDIKLEEMVSSYLKKLSGDDHSVNEKLVGLGKAVKRSQAQEKREAALKRVMGGDGLKAMKEIAKDKNSVAISELVPAVKESVNSKKWLNIAITLVSIFTLVPLSLYLAIGAGSTVALVGTAAAVTMLVSAAIMFVIDYFYGYNAHRDQDRPGIWDKSLIYFSQGLAVASIASMVAIAIVTGAAIGPLGWIAITVTAVWMIQNERARSAINACERNYKIENPTLELIAEGIESGDDQLWTAMFNNLIRKDQEFIIQHSFLAENIRAEIARRKSAEIEQFNDFFSEQLEPDLSSASDAPDQESKPA